VTVFHVPCSIDSGRPEVTAPTCSRRGGSAGPSHDCLFYNTDHPFNKQASDRLSNLAVTVLFVPYLTVTILYVPYSLDNGKLRTALLGGSHRDGGGFGALGPNFFPFCLCVASLQDEAGKHKAV